MRNLILLISLTFSSVWAFSQKPEIGIAEHLKNDSVITAAGFSCNTESIGRWVSPIAVSDEQFEKNKRMAKMGFQNKIVIEGFWEDLSVIGKMTKDFLQNQIDEVYR